MINPEISSHDLKELDKVLKTNKETILKDIWVRYLQGIVEKDNLISEFLDEKHLPKIKHIVKEKKIQLEDRCMARIWSKGEPRQCNVAKIKSIDYCNTHLYNRNYGRIDEEIINQ